MFARSNNFSCEKFVEGRTLDWMDTEFKPQDPEGKLPTSMLFGPLVTRAKFFQLCSPEVQRPPSAYLSLCYYLHMNISKVACCWNHMAGRTSRWDDP